MLYNISYIAYQISYIAYKMSYLCKISYIIFQISYILYKILYKISSILPASVAQLDAPSDWRPGGHTFNPRRGRQHSFVEIDHEIFSKVILTLPLIQEGQLSVLGEIMLTA